MVGTITVTNNQKTTQKIEGGEHNVQVGRDVIINEKASALEQALIENVISPYLAESGKELTAILSENIKQDLGAKVKELVNGEIIQSVKDEIKANNIQVHIEAVIRRVQTEKVQANEETQRNGNNESISDRIKKLDFLGEWIDEVENIPPEDEVMSKLWQSWLVDMLKGKVAQKKQIVFKKMKLLSAVECC